jgi:hypothetical protein
MAIVGFMSVLQSLILGGAEGAKGFADAGSILTMPIIYSMLLSQH